MADTQRVEIKNRLNRQLIIYTDEAKTAENAYPLPPLGVRTLLLTDEQKTFVRSSYGRDIIVG